jgi:hypothetical protein
VSEPPDGQKEYATLIWPVAEKYNGREGGPAIWRKEKLVLGIFGGNLLYTYALMMPIRLNAFGVNHNQPFRIPVPKASRISVQIIVRIWPENPGGTPVLLAATSMAACKNCQTKNFNRPGTR